MLLIALGFTLAHTLVYSQSLSFNGLSEVHPLTRGKTYRLNWLGGTKENPIHMNYPETSSLLTNTTSE